MPAGHAWAWVSREMGRHASKRARAQPLRLRQRACLPACLFGARTEPAPRRQTHLDGGCAGGAVAVAAHPRVCVLHPEHGVGLQAGRRDAAGDGESVPEKETELTGGTDAS